MVRASSYIRLIHFNYPTICHVHNFVDNIFLNVRLFLKTGKEYAQMKWFLVIGAAVLLGLVPASIDVSASGVQILPPSPNGVTLQVSHPTFEEGVEAPAATSIYCTLKFQGTSVDMPFDSTDGACVYTWPKALASGAYSATVTVSAGGATSSSQALQFHIGPSAVSSLSHTSLMTLHALQFVDLARLAEGIPIVRYDSGLQAAAQAHALYLTDVTGPYLNGSDKTLEPDPTASGFTGNTPADRAAAFGAVAPGGVDELISGLSPESSLFDQMDTLFARLAMLDPRTITLGAAYDSGGSQAVLDFGVGDSAPTTPLSWEFPWSGATGIQTTYNIENPNPLASTPAWQLSDSETGYPASITFNPAVIQSVHLNAATLSANGQTVPVFVFDGQNYSGQDPYPDGSVSTTVALFAQSRLAYSTTYTAHVTGTLTMLDGATQPFDDSWSFTTEPPPQVLSAWQDGSYLFVDGQGLLGAEISVSQTYGGNAALLHTLYRDSHLLAFKVESDAEITQIDVGPYWSAQVTPATVNNPPLSDTSTSASSLVDVNLAWAQGLVKGYPSGTFQPDATIIGAQAVAMLYNSLGSPAVPSGAVSPSGVPAWAQKAVEWALANGVVKSSDGFSADGKATRAQLITWLMRAFQIPPSSAAPTFTDASAIPAQFAGYVASAQDLGLASGYPDGTFRPNDPVTRGAFTIWVVNAVLPSPAEWF